MTNNNKRRSKMKKLIVAWLIMGFLILGSFLDVEAKPGKAGKAKRHQGK